MSNAAQSLAELLHRAPRERVEHDPEWTSPCVVDRPDGEGRVGWTPVLVADPPDLSSVEAAAGEPLHPDAVTFLTSWFAGPIACRHSGESVLLMLAWNEEAAENALRGLVAHAVAQRADRGRFSVPIAWTDSDWTFAIDNRTGAIVLEEPFRPPLRTVAASLAEFLDALCPAE